MKSSRFFISRGVFRLAAFMTCVLGLMAERGEAAAPRPNVVFILADDMGYSDLGCHGGEIETPNLDLLAAHGLRFTQFYNTARCWPSRAALLTGYNAQQVNRDPQGLRPAWAPLLPDLLKPAGYRSYHSGKWHVDGEVLEGGFERSYSLDDHNRFFSPDSHKLDDKPLPKPKPEEGYYSTTAIASRAIEWLGEHDREHGDDPFFLYVAFTSPHFPIQAPAEDIARYRGRYADGWDKVRERRWERMRKLGLVDTELSDRDPITIPGWNLPEAELKERVGSQEVGHAVAWDDLTSEQKAFQAEKMAVHAAMVDRMDREIGRVLKQLEAMDALENTIVFFASDNGASAEQIIRGDGHDPSAPPGSARTFLGVGPGWSTAANTPFRLHKSWTHEGGIATPLVVSWPAGIKAHGELRHTPGHLIDIVPTVLELAGVPAPESWNGEDRPPMPGRSLAPALAKDVDLEREALYFSHSGNRGLRVGDWKIVSTGQDGPWELYDLAKDRAEMHDLASRRPEKVKELVEHWTRLDEEFRKQGATGKPLPKRGQAAKAETKKKARRR